MGIEDVASELDGFAPKDFTDGGGHHNGVPVAFETRWHRPRSSCGDRSARVVPPRRDCRGGWTPRELRHHLVSLMSDAGVPLEDIARMVGHRNTMVNELVYRKQLRPIVTEGTDTMNRLFQGTATPPSDVP